MKTIKIVPFVLLLVGVNAQALILTCTGTDNAKTQLNIEFNSNPQTQTLKVNGIEHKIEAPTKDRTGVATENFATTNNVIVYDSFLKDRAGTYHLHRFNAMTDETIFDTPLNCQVKK